MDNFVIFVIAVLVIGGGIYFFNKGKGKESTPVVSKPTPAPAPAPAPKEVAKEEVKKAPTKAVLNKMTKKELDMFAKSEFGISLDARLKKDDMIKSFQKEVKNAK